MNKNNCRGAITVYLSIVLSAVILLCGILIDIVRIRAAEIQVRRAANTAASSVLAGFNTNLKEEYGIFALHNSDYAYLNEAVKRYMASQLYAKEMDSDAQTNYVDLFNYRIENIEAIPVYNLTENEITRHQITEYMKYRAPAQLAEDLLDKINYAASSEEATTAYKNKTSLEKKLGNIERALTRLQRHIDRINAFEKKNYDSSPASNSLLMKYCENMILKEIYRGCSRASFANLETPEEIQQAEEVKMKILDLSFGAQEDAERRKVSMIEEIQKCRDAIDNARQELKIIKELREQAQQDLEKMKSYLKDIRERDKSGRIDDSSIISAMEKDIEKYEKLLAEENSQSILEDLNNNLEVLSDLQNSISSLAPWLMAQSGEISSKALKDFEESLSINVVDQHELNQLMKKLSSDNKLKSIDIKADDYTTISNVLQKGSGSKGKDPRKSAADAAKKIKNEVKDLNNSKKIENPELLPSYYSNGSYPNKIFSDSHFEDSVGNEALPRIIRDFDVDFDEDSSFMDEGLDYIIALAQKLKEKSLDMRNEIYVNEYILSTFKDAVEIEGSETELKVKNTFFEKGEVEYILCGNSSEEINKALVKGQIFLIRLGMNTLHVYSDPQKRLQALETAAAVAGVTGFGVPIVHNLIMCAWGAAEAVLDVQDIYEGKKVPFIKTADNWRTDLLPSGFSAKAEVQGEGSIMDFDYHDYLRLLLLAEDKETKINRVEDLIQLNMQQDNPGYKLNSSNTYIKLKVQASIKYWFITRIFVPSKSKTDDGRHLINVELWRGY